MANSGGASLVGPDLLARSQVSVQVRQFWSGSWRTVPFMTVSAVEQNASPGIDTAKLLYHYGRISWPEYGGGFYTYGPLNLAGWYCRVLIYRAGVSFPIFTGVIVDQDFDMHGAQASPNSGDEILTAHGIEYLLTKSVITGAYCVTSQLAGDAVTTGGVIASTPTFNRRQRSEEVIKGNRSQTVDGTYGVHLFSTDRQTTREGYLWTNLDILRYLLRFYGPGDVPIVLSGQYNALGSIEALHRFEGQTLKQAIDTLIDRHRGLGWSFRYSDSTAYLHIYTAFPYDVRASTSITFPGNTEKFYFDLGSHVDVQSSVVKIMENTRYDQVVVAGDRIETMFSVQVQDFGGEMNGMIPGWTLESDEFNDYITDPKPLDATDEKLCDEARRGDRFENVFQKFVLSDTWDGLALITPDGLGSAYQPCAIPTFEDGVLQQSQPSALFMGDKTLMRQLPWRKSATDEYIAPLAFAPDPDADAPIDPVTGLNENWVQLDAIDDSAERPSASLRIADDCPGLLIKSRVNHILAKGTYDPDANEFPSKYEPIYNYANLIFTIGLALDEKLYLRRVIRATSAPRVLYIDAPHCKLQYIAPGTVIATENGNLKRVGATDNVPRNDFERLQVLGALAATWYGQSRAAVRLSVRNAVKLGEVGQYITAVSGGTKIQQVGTVITSQRWIFEGDRVSTSIETGWYEIDVSRVLEFSGIGTPKQLAREVGNMRRDVNRLYREANTNRFDRIPAAGGGGGAGDGTSSAVEPHTHRGIGDGGFAVQLSGTG